MDAVLLAYLNSRQSLQLNTLGTIDAGIKCAAWSPDGTYLVVVDGA